MIDPETVARGGVFAGWMLFAATAVPIALRGRTGSRRRDRTSLVGIALQALGFAIAWNWHSGADAPMRAARESVRWSVAGLAAALAAALALASAVFAVAAVGHLGRQWSFVARVADDHALVTTGPYAVVRHPIYSAMLGLLVATGLTFGTLRGTAVAMVLYYVGAIVRVRVEERLLAATFGPAHADYVRRVPAIFPGLW